VFAKEDEDWGSLIDNLHVAPGLGRRGIGRALMGAAAGWLTTNFPDDLCTSGSSTAMTMRDASTKRSAGETSVRKSTNMRRTDAPRLSVCVPHPGAISA